MMTIIAKVLDHSTMHASSAYSRVLSAGPILKARSIAEPNQGWLTVLVILLAVLGVLRLVVRVSIARTSSARQVVLVADEEMACIGESYGTMEMDEDMEVVGMKQDVVGADFA